MIKLIPSLSCLLVCSMMLIIFLGTTFGAANRGQQEQRKGQVEEDVFYMYKVKPKNNDQVQLLLQTTTRYMGGFKPLFLQAVQSKTSTITLVPDSKVQWFNDFLASNQIFGVYKGISTIRSIELDPDQEESDKEDMDYNSPMLLQQPSSDTELQRYNVSENKPRGEYGCSYANYCYKFCNGNTGSWCFTRKGCGDYWPSTQKYPLCAQFDWCGSIRCGAGSGCVTEC